MAHADDDGGRNGTWFVVMCWFMLYVRRDVVVCCDIVCNLIAMYVVDDIVMVLCRCSPPSFSSER